MKLYISNIYHEITCLYFKINEKYRYEFVADYGKTDAYSSYTKEREWFFDQEFKESL